VSGEGKIRRKHRVTLGGGEKTTKKEVTFSKGNIEKRNACAPRPQHGHYQEKEFQKGKGHRGAGGES